VSWPRRLGDAGSLLLAALVACSDSTTAPPGTRPTTALRLVPVDSGYDFSIFIAAPPGDTTRLLVVERGGRILLRKHGVRQDSAFLNLTGLTGLGHEYGVYSIAFHPQYATNRRLFAYYVDNNGDTRVAEFRADVSFDHADPPPGREILAVAQSATADLYGGEIAFGPDGMLYIALGDGDGGGDPLSRSQDSTSLLGKMLRLDIDSGDPYGVPPDNPYANRPGWRPEIWQLGLRNPWRWSFDRETGDLWIGDVGEAEWEEIDVLPSPLSTGGGQNYGWPRMEGDHCYQPAVACQNASFVLPVWEYSHSPACAIMGGYVYRGSAFAALAGTYFYGDYCGGWVRTLRFNGGTLVEPYPALASPLINDNPVSFGEDAAGEVYVAMASGRVYRIEATP
jgi:glucose/arabinose dehydrogenase